MSAILPQLVGNSPAAVHIYRSGITSAAKLALEFLQEGQCVTVVARDLAEFNAYKGLLTLFSPSDSLAEPAPNQVQWEQTFITMPHHPATLAGKSGWAERMAALYALQRHRKGQGVLVTLDNFLLRLPPLTVFADHELVLVQGMEMAPDLVLEQAIDWGYTRSPMVNMPGEIAIRGDILDIFCPGYTKPLRLEFFGDTLEDIRLFDAMSQRSLADIKEMVMLPVAPVIGSQGLRKEAKDFWMAEVKAGRLEKEHLAGLERSLDAGGAGLFSGCYYPKASTLESWLPHGTVLLLPGELDVPELLTGAESTWAKLLENEYEVKGTYQPKSLVLRPADEVLSYMSKHSRLYMTELRIGLQEETDSVSLPEYMLQSFTDVFSEQAAKHRPWQHLVAAMKAFSRQGNKNKSKDALRLSEIQSGAEQEERIYDLLREASGQGQLLLSFANERSRKKFLTLAEQDGVTPYLRYSPHEPGVYALVSPYRQGSILGWAHTVILGEDVMQPRVEKAKRIPKGAFQGLDRYDSLKEGDYLVHRDYGVGVFDGLHRMRLGDVENDYLLLRYADDDKLYLPVDRLSLVQRYTCSDGTEPQADKLGGTFWSSSKEKARKAIEKIAADLVEMYALRKLVKGFSYSPIGEIYREFEATFGFEETPDQAKAIDDVLADMEKPEPMDRLICGDVGFGKTEVALRAAFRAALEGRQVAVLCPTTVLAEQHYQTFRSRLAAFPVHVGMLSRFVTKAKQKEVLEAAAQGQIDILIGTHRLLSKDVVLPNLGLLVLDEEQRFGVRHKERLKEMRKNVDALTLTATPIPRTLQLSLSGIRELSIIETPPLERKPVVTALIDRDEEVLRSILERELARQGQVFWVYNRVMGLERAAEFVKKLAPHARVGMAHGQMSEVALEKVMHQFWHRELDVLVCTAIIESGLDFPNANTLIVDQAQMFGLGQLYQLRGRVGRSDKQAFAVFVTPEPDRLPEIARQRLRIILDMDYLGAGFQVAMEDLRLRGAGNILGESQSGHMNRLGLELFLEMLEEAVAKLKGQPLGYHAEAELALGIPAFIPESYMGDNKERLRYYKLLSSAQTDAAQQEVVFEIRDRFGPLPEELDNFTAVLGFKRYISSLYVAKADIFTDKVKLVFAPEAPVEPARLVDLVTGLQAAGRHARLQPPCVLELPCQGATVEEKLINVRLILEEATKPQEQGKD